MKNLILLASFLFFSLNLLAQDTIVKKDGSVLNVKITEVGTQEIKFKTQNKPDAPVIAIKMEELQLVKIGGQTIYTAKQETPKEVKLNDVLVKKDGSTLNIKVVELGTQEVKFKLSSDPESPIISIARDDIKSLKVGDQYVINEKKEQEDVIVKKDGTSIKVKVLELTEEDVKFKLYNNPEGPTMSYKKSDIKTVKVNGQVVYEFKEDPYSISNNAILDKTSCAKFHFFSPLSNHLAFSYEWMSKPGFNYEGGIGIIGPGVGAFDNFTKTEPVGGFARFGPKFLLGNNSDVEVKGGRLAHPLKGRYIKPEIILNAMSARYTIDTGGFGGGTISYKKKYQSIALHLVYGRQNIYGNSLTVGYYIGIGYGFESITRIGNVPSNNYFDYDPRRYSHVFFGKDFPMSFTYGLTIGWLHKPIKPKAEKSYKNNPRA